MIFLAYLGREIDSMTNNSEKVTDNYKNILRVLEMRRKEGYNGCPVHSLVLIQVRDEGTSPRIECWLPTRRLGRHTV